MDSKLKLKNNSYVAKTPQETIERKYYLDWLRVVAIILVFVLHIGKIFDYHTTVMANIDRSLLLSILREFLLLWLMPIFFVISGAAIFLSIELQKTTKFIKSRIFRLLVPSVIVGTFIINPPYVYMEKLFSAKTELNFIKWYPHFFEGFYGAGGNFAPWGMGTHIWYLMYLFIFSIVFLPLFIPFKKTGASILQKASFPFENPWVLLTLFIPVSVVAYMFEKAGMGGIRMTGSWDAISYIFFLLYGYMIYSNQGIQNTIKKYSPVFLAGALVMTIFHLLSHFGIGIQIEGVTRHDITTGELLPLDRSMFSLVQAFRGVQAWCWVIALLGMAQKHLNFDNKYRANANESVLPFYILHHSIIYIIGFYVIQWHVGVSLKFCLIAIIAFAVITITNEFLIKRINTLRFLFGMKRNKPTIINTKLLNK